MTPFQSICLIVFGIIAYMMWVDENVSVYVNLMFKMTKVNVERFVWMVRFHPKNPITNLIMKWKYDKLARELEKEFQDKNGNRESS